MHHENSPIGEQEKIIPKQKDSRTKSKEKQSSTACRNQADDKGGYTDKIFDAKLTQIIQQVLPKEKESTAASINQAAVNEGNKEQGTGGGASTIVYTLTPQGLVMGNTDGNCKNLTKEKECKTAGVNQIGGKDGGESKMNNANVTKVVATVTKEGIIQLVQPGQTSVPGQPVLRVIQEAGKASKVVLSNLTQGNDAAQKNSSGKESSAEEDWFEKAARKMLGGGNQEQDKSVDKTAESSENGGPTANRQLEKCSEIGSIADENIEEQSSNDRVTEAENVEETQGSGEFSETNSESAKAGNITEIPTDDFMGDHGVVGSQIEGEKNADGQIKSQDSESINKQTGFKENDMKTTHQKSSKIIKIMYKPTIGEEFYEDSFSSVTCILCGTQLESSIEYLKHLLNECSHKNQNKVLRMKMRCKLCPNRSFYTYDSLYKHILEAHSTLVPCEVCGVKVRSHLVSLRIFRLFIRRTNTYCCKIIHTN